jgi:lipopolysaccharide heptosyltransferase II
MFLKKIDSLFGSWLVGLWPKPKQTKSPSPPASRLLIIRPGGIGDAVLLIPVFTLLRKTFPAAHIEVLAETRNKGVFALCPAVDRVLCYDRPLELLQVLRNRYDVVIDSEQWYRLSAIVVRMICSRMSIGFATNERRRLFTHPVDYDRDVYEAQSFFNLLQPLDLVSPLEIAHCFLSVPVADQNLADRMLKPVADRPFVVLFPGASVPEKSWGTTQFRDLTLRLHDAGYAVVVVGGKEDVSAAAALTSETAALNLAGKTTLLETAGILKHCRLLISGDSGILHMGVGLGKSTVSIFGPSNAAKWAPKGDRHVVINHHLPCSPCSHFGMMPTCPIGVQCIRDISVDEVFLAAQKLLNSTNGGADAS